MDSVTKKTIENCIADFPFTSFSFTALKTPTTIDAYKQWLKNNFHGSMSYLRDHLSFKEFPKTLFDQSLSAIVVTKDYFPAPQKSNLPIHNLRVAEYAKNDDYHDWFKDQLDQLISKLEVEFPGEVFTAMTDSKPVLERDLAQKAGLGWFGKNTCLIDSKQGSLFFICLLYTSDAADE